MALQEPLPSQRDCVDCPIRHRAVCARCEPDELGRVATRRGGGRRADDASLLAVLPATRVLRLDFGAGQGLQATLSQTGQTPPRGFKAREDQSLEQSTAAMASEFSLEGSWLEYCFLQSERFWTLNSDVGSTVDPGNDSMHAAINLSRRPDGSGVSTTIWPVSPYLRNSSGNSRVKGE